MPWFKVDDGFSHHPKVMAADPAAIGLWVMAGAWSCQNGTDGFVPDYVLTRLVPNGIELAENLVAVGLWKRKQTRSKTMHSGYTFHDWRTYQPDAKKVQELRTKRAEAGKKGGVASGNARSKREASAASPASASAQPNAQAKRKQNRTPNPNPNPYPRKDPPYSPPTGDGTDQPTFDDFWTVYPRRIGKKAAAKAWDKALADGVPAAKIVDAAARYRDSRQGEPQKFTKHPTTWLNQGCWDDEPRHLRLVDDPAEDEIDPDSVLGLDYWAPPPPPPEVEERSEQEIQEWYAARRAEHHQERLTQARRLLTPADQQEGSGS